MSRNQKTVIVNIFFGTLLALFFVRSFSSQHKDFKDPFNQEDPFLDDQEKDLIQFPCLIKVKNSPKALLKRSKKMLLTAGAGCFLLGVVCGFLINKKCLTGLFGKLNNYQAINEMLSKDNKRAEREILKLQKQISRKHSRSKSLQSLSTSEIELGFQVHISYEFAVIHSHFLNLIISKDISSEKNIEEHLLALTPKDRVIISRELYRQRIFEKKEFDYLIPHFFKRMQKTKSFSESLQGMVLSFFKHYFSWGNNQNSICDKKDLIEKIKKGGLEHQYLYHSTPNFKAFKSILSSGAIRAEQGVPGNSSKKPGSFVSIGQPAEGYGDYTFELKFGLLFMELFQTQFVTNSIIWVSFFQNISINSNTLNAVYVPSSKVAAVNSWFKSKNMKINVNLNRNLKKNNLQTIIVPRHLDTTGKCHSVFKIVDDTIKIDHRWHSNTTFDKDFLYKPILDVDIDKSVVNKLRSKYSQISKDKAFSKRLCL